ncbi:MAG: efflux RND transporter periplasmic adaptor subunit [Betaproteobacteria bacterium]|nr:efflux RND transporter periplasmic adaptor subunit [Betaproteobacteria bacterium]
MIAVAAWIFLAPEPIDVEVTEATRGPLEVTVDQEGEVRVHDRYVIAAPVAGKLVRVILHDGDPVAAGQTVATLEPAPLDPRAREEAIARLAAARALVGEAQHRVSQAAASLALAKRERERFELLVAERFVSSEAAEKARTTEKTAAAELDAARSRESAAHYEQKAAEAVLLSLPAADGKERPLVNLESPVAGKVLRVLERSERTVAAGTQVMVIGDPSRFEIVADVLSSDAVKIKPGAPARLVAWGGDKELEARVRVVEPYAFTKVSALGIEEKRVNVVMDPVDSLGPLGDGYRVEARVVIWAEPDVLQVPAAAVFRSGTGWAVFVVRDGRAHRRAVRIGQRNPFAVQILEGLSPGDRVVKYPGNQIEDGSRVRAQP